MLKDDIEILRNSWLMTTNHDLDEQNKAIKNALSNILDLAIDIEHGLYMPKADVEEYYIPIEHVEDDYIEKTKIYERIDNLITTDNGDNFNLTNVVMILKSLLNKQDSELDKDYINIQEIEELPDSIGEHLSDTRNTKINELIKAVKQLDIRISKKGE